MTDFAEKVRNLKMLPAEDKELLANAAAISYGHAQAILGDLSIFIQKNKKNTTTITNIMKSLMKTCFI